MDDKGASHHGERRCLFIMNDYKSPFFCKNLQKRLDAISYGCLYSGKWVPREAGDLRNPSTSHDSTSFLALRVVRP